MDGEREIIYLAISNLILNCADSLERSKKLPPEHQSREEIEILEEYKGKDISCYLYKKGSPNGTDLTPTSKVAASLEKTFQIKFLKWFENYEEYELTDQDKKQLKEMKVAIESKKDEILAALEEKFTQKKKDENYLITLACCVE